MTRGLVLLLAAAVALMTGCASLTERSPESSAPEHELFIGLTEDAFKLVPDSALPVARELGVATFRITVPWEPGARTLPPDVVAQLDAMMKARTSERFVVALYGLQDATPLDEAARDDYCAYAADLVERYPAIGDLVVWNEPNKSYFWQPQFDEQGQSAAPAAYVELLARCWDVLHDLRPEVNLIAPATSPKGNDLPDARSNISHSPGTFIREMGLAYRSSGRDQPLFDTIGHHAYGASPAEPPATDHGGSIISEGDYADLVDALSEAFTGTAQAIPGACVDDRCTYIWYLETGFQTTVSPDKLEVYTGEENVETISPQEQAAQFEQAVELAYCQPFVRGYFNFLLWDEARLEGWQSGPFWADQTPKDSYEEIKQVIADATAGRIDCSTVEGAPAAG
ncbi:MAG TPA: hypothetical protein VES61_05950 [Gaiellaceae bacterium]|nr:hypothetical protein [Gaiellaceae bacterium]